MSSDIKKTKTELCGKYCASLGDNVLIMRSELKNGTVTEKCLSSHLCGSEGKKCRSSDNGKNENQNIC